MGRRLSVPRAWWLEGGKLTCPLLSQTGRRRPGLPALPPENEDPAMPDLTASSEFMRLMEIEFDELSATRVTGTVAADERHHQPWGLVHGGHFTAVIESFATVGAFEAVRDHGQQAVGLTNVTDFLRPHRSGRLQVTALPIQQGRS